jgi:hypothetical protein
MCILISDKYGAKFPITLPAVSGGQNPQKNAAV